MSFSPKRTTCPHCTKPLVPKTGKFSLCCTECIVNKHYQYLAVYEETGEPVREFLCFPELHAKNDYKDNTLTISFFSKVGAGTHKIFSCEAIEWDLDDLPTLLKKLKTYVVFS